MSDCLSYAHNTPPSLNLRANALDMPQHSELKSTRETEVVDGFCGRRWNATLFPPECRIFSWQNQAAFGPSACHARLAGRQGTCRRWHSEQGSCFDSAQHESKKGSGWLAVSGKAKKREINDSMAGRWTERQPLDLYNIWEKGPGRRRFTKATVPQILLY